MRTEGWIAAATSLIVVAIALPGVRTLAVRLGLYDPPGHLKLHTQPIPRLGGVPMALALLMGLLISGIGVSYVSISFLAALAMIWMVGLGDDLRGFSPEVRLLAHLGAGFLLWQAGWRLPILQPAVLNAAGTCLFVAFLVSAFNMLDGADGIAGGTTAVIALGYAALSGTRLGHLGSAVAWSLLGTCAGFLLFNFPPAKIFMGDSGSTILGFMVAFLGLDFYRGQHGYGSYLLAPVCFAAVPVADALFAIVRRLRSGSSAFAGDRRHFYDVLLQSGWPAQRVAYCSYAATSVVVLVGWLCDREPFLAMLALMIMLSAMLAAIRLRMFRPAGLVNFHKVGTPIVQGSKKAESHRPAA